jgi:nucleotide-binding universal stress UspA family protein
MSNYKSKLLGQVETIMISTDGSKYSEGAVQEAIFFAQACGAKLIVLHAVQLDDSSESAMVASSGGTAGVIDIRPHIEEIEKMASDNEINCETVVVETYQVDKAIVETAREKNVDVVIMGRHGKRGLLKLLVGSMTSRVIGYGFPKVLVVPKDCTITGETILLATDGSSHSQKAADETMSLGENCSSVKNIITVSVAESEETLVKAQEIVKRVNKNCKDAECDGLAVVGRPAKIIIETSRGRKADMIIMGGFGEGLSKKIMGHATEKVIGNADCAVLVVQ